MQYDVYLGRGNDNSTTPTVAPRRQRAATLNMPDAQLHRSIARLKHEVTNSLRLCGLSAQNDRICRRHFPVALLRETDYTILDPLMQRTVRERSCHLTQSLQLEQSCSGSVVPHKDRRRESFASRGSGLALISRYHAFDACQGEVEEEKRKRTQQVYSSFESGCSEFP